MLEEIKKRAPISGADKLMVVDPAHLLSILDSGVVGEMPCSPSNEDTKDIIAKIIELLSRLIKLLFVVFLPIVGSAQTEVQTSGIITDGLSVADKVLGMFEDDQCDEVRVVKSRKKGVTYINKLVKQLQRLDKKWAKNEIDDLTYYYSKAYLLEMSIADVAALERKTMQLGAVKVRDYKHLKKK